MMVGHQSREQTAQPVKLSCSMVVAQVCTGPQWWHAVLSSRHCPMVRWTEGKNRVKQRDHSALATTQKNDGKGSKQMGERDIFKLMRDGAVTKLEGPRECSGDDTP